MTQRDGMGREEGGGFRMGLKPDTVSDAGFAALGKLLDNMMLQFLCL